MCVVMNSDAIGALGRAHVMACITRCISERVHMGVLTFDKQHGT